MAVTVLISATLRSFAGRKANISLEGDSVEEVLNALIDQYPDIGKALFDEEKRPQPFVNIYVNEKNIRALDGFDTRVSEGDFVLLLPAIAGGAPTDSLISPERSKEAALDDKEIERYSKHLLLRDIGIKGQKRLKAAKVLIVGLGGLGAPLAQYLAAAGVGTIGLVDFDEVQLPNLQNQVIHGKRDLNRPKVASAKDTIRAINPLVNVETYPVALDVDNAEEIIAGYDVVADATDNYKARYIINDVCAMLGKPDVSGSMYQFEGRVSVYDAAQGPCYRCQFPAPPPSGLVPSCAESGVISALPGIIGSMQANEVLKLLIGGGESLIGGTLVFDAWSLYTRRLYVEKDENCPVCGKNSSVFSVAEFDYDEFCGLKEDEQEEPIESIDPEELVARMQSGEPLTIIDIREPHERAITRFPATVIPIGQLARRQKELNPEIDTIFICREGKRSILAIRTLREAGYKGPMYNLKGGLEAAKEIILPHEGAWL